MIKVAGDLTGFTLEDYQNMFSRIDGVLQKREILHQCYLRNSKDSQVLFGDLSVPFEKFIVDLASGYLAGKPTYNIDKIDDTAKQVRERYFNKESMDDAQIDEMKAIIEYVVRYNDDDQEVYKLIHDLLEYGACYEILYENEDNELIYNNFSALDTVAIWDTNIPSNLIAIISKYSEQDKNNNVYDLFRVVDKSGVKVYNRNTNKEVREREELREDKLWDDVPGFAVEIDFSIIENCESLIKTYESLLSNIKDTYKYNAEDCKLKITGYKAQNRLTIKNEKGETIINPDRVKEDEYILQSKTFYTEEGGDAGWLIKPTDANGATTLLKYYVDSIFQMAGIPNTSDLAFNSSDLNASAIDRKFYVMNVKTEEIISELKKGLLRRFELIFGRLNMKFSTNYDFRYITIDIGKNLPSMEDENIERMLKLDGILSEQTVIEELGYDYMSEKSKKEDEVNELSLFRQDSSSDKEEGEEINKEDNESDQGDNSDFNSDEERRSE